MISEDYTSRESSEVDSVEYEEVSVRGVAEERVALFEHLVERAIYWDRERLRFITIEMQIPLDYASEDADLVYGSLAEAEHAGWLRDRADVAKIHHARAARALIEAEFPLERWITCEDRKTVVYIQPAQRKMGGEYTEPCVLFEEIRKDEDPTGEEAF